MKKIILEAILMLVFAIVGIGYYELSKGCTQAWILVSIGVLSHVFMFYHAVKLSNLLDAYDKIHGR